MRILLSFLTLCLLASLASAAEPEGVAAATCPCEDPSRWSDPSLGQVWQDFAAGFFDPAATTCREDDGIELESGGTDSGRRAASIEPRARRCRVVRRIPGVPKEELTLGGLSAGDAASCRKVLRAAAERAGLICRH